MDFPWWTRAVVYQVYPRSFADSDGDGVGDLAGVIGRLDHLSRPRRGRPLAVALLPVADGGLRLRRGRLHRRRSALRRPRHLRPAGRRGPWPRHPGDRRLGAEPLLRPPRRGSGPRAPRARTRTRDWYVWRDGRPGGLPPNDWVSTFGGPAWTFDPPSGQWYLHAFASAQPDLNWANPELAEAMLDTLRFWLDRGVDGFRIDVVQELGKRPGSALPRGRVAPGAGLARGPRDRAAHPGGARRVRRPDGGGRGLRPRPGAGSPRSW